MRVGMGTICERGCPHLTGAELEGLCDGLQEFAVSQCEPVLVGVEHCQLTSKVLHHVLQVCRVCCVCIMQSSIMCRRCVGYVMCVSCRFSIMCCRCVGYGMCVSCRAPRYRTLRE